MLYGNGMVPYLVQYDTLDTQALVRTVRSRTARQAAMPIAPYRYRTVRYGIVPSHIVLLVDTVSYRVYGTCTVPYGTLHVLYRTVRLHRMHFYRTVPYVTVRHAQIYPYSNMPNHTS